MTIRKKLTLLYTGLLAGFIIVSSVVIFAVVRSAWLGTVDTALWETTQQVIDNSHSYAIREFGSPTEIRIELPELDVFRASGVGVQVWSDLSNPNPKLAGVSGNLRNYRRPLDPSTLGTFASVYTTILNNDVELRVLTRTVTVSGQNRPLYNIQVAASLETINQATNTLSVFMLIGGTLAVVISFGMGLLLSNQALKPVENIIQAANSISSAKDLKTRLPWDGPVDELGMLTSVFNRMMDRLEHLFGVQQRFVADVSHELRTPLTAICGNLDLAKRYGMDAASMEAIESEAERMTRMVNDLLLLARADYGGMTLDLAELDLDTVMADVYRQAKVLAKDRQLEIKLEHLEPVRIMGHADRMKQLLLNLVNNAINFTPDSGSIRLWLKRDGEQAVLQVEDNGTGIPPEHLERIFDRFYQAEPSRARSANGSSGAGLGLSIAKWIVEAHGGSIEVESAVNKGTTFTVRLPALPPCPLDDDSADSGHISRDTRPAGSGRGRFANMPRLRRGVPATENES